MILQYNDYTDKIAYFTVKADGNIPVSGEQEPTYTMVTFGNMSYIVGGVIVIFTSIILFRMFTKKSTGCSSCSSCPSSSSCHSKATNE